MFKEQMSKIKKLILRKTNEEEKGEKENKTNKRKIENLFFFLLILIITLIAINTILKDDKTGAKDEENAYKVLAESQVDTKRKY